MLLQLIIISFKIIVLVNQHNQSTINYMQENMCLYRKLYKILNDIEQTNKSLTQEHTVAEHPKYFCISAVGSSTEQPAGSEN